MACDTCDDNSIELPLGPQGDDGNDGNYVTVVNEPAGAICAAGGLKIEVKSGVDGSLVSGPFYTCNGVNGANGANGVDGTNSLGQTYSGVNNVATSYAGTTIGTSGSPINSLALPLAGTYLVTVDILCRQGADTNWALYEDNSQSFGFAEFRYQMNGSVQSLFNASSQSDFLPNSDCTPYTPILAGAVNTPYYKVIQTKQTASKSFFVTITGAETISLYLWLSTNYTASVSKPATMYTYKSTITALKVT